MFIYFGQFAADYPAVDGAAANDADQPVYAVQPSLESQADDDDHDQRKQQNPDEHIEPKIIFLPSVLPSCDCTS